MGGVGKLGVGDRRLPAQRLGPLGEFGVPGCGCLLGELGEVLVDHGVDPADEERRHRTDLG